MSKLAAAGLSSTVATGPDGPLPRVAVAAASAPRELRSTAACLERRRPLGVREARGRGTRVQVGPLSPMRTAAAARSATTAASASMATSLARPPAISTIGGAKPRSAAMTASGCVPCESLTKRTPSTIATSSSRCSTPRKPADRAPDGVRRDAEEQARRDRREHVADVVPPGDRDLVERHDPAARAGRRRRRPRRRQPLHAGRHDPAIDDADPARASAARAGTAPGAAPSPAYADDDRVLGIEHQARRRIDELGQAALDGAVRLERAVAIEVIRGHVGVDGDRRAARQRRQLQLGQLEHDAMRRRQLGQALHERHADVAAQHDRRPAARRGRPRSATTVVVLPFVPVTPMVGAGHSRRKRSTSLTTGGHRSPAAARSRRAPRGGAARSSGSRLLIDGDVATRAAPASASRGIDARARAARRTAPALERRDRVRQLARGRRRRRPSPAPRARQEARQATPLRARPSTVTGRPRERVEDRGHRRGPIESRRVAASIVTLVTAARRRGEEERHAEHRREHARRSRSAG